MRIAVLTTLLAALPSFATSFHFPKQYEVFSANQTHVLEVNTETKTHSVYDMRDRTKALWSFKGEDRPDLLSNDGQVVVTVSWPWVKEDDILDQVVVQFRNRDGEFRSYPLRDLCPDPPRTQDLGRGGPIGPFWRTWYTHVADHGDSFTVPTTRGIAYRFRYSDGEIVEQYRFGWHRWAGWVWAGILAGGLTLTVLVLVKWRRAKLRAARPSSPSSTVQ